MVDSVLMDIPGAREYLRPGDALLRVPFEARNCQLLPAPAADPAAGEPIAVVLNTVADAGGPLLADESPLVLWRNVLHTVDAATQPRLRGIIVVDRRDKSSQRAWSASALQAARTEQARLGNAQLWVDPVIENSCYGLHVLSAALSKFPHNACEPHAPSGTA